MKHTINLISPYIFFTKDIGIWHTQLQVNLMNQVNTLNHHWYSNIWNQLTISSWVKQLFWSQACGVQRFYCQECMQSVLYPAKNEEIYGIVSYQNFPCDFTSFLKLQYVDHKWVISRLFSRSTGEIDAWLTFNSAPETMYNL